MTATQSIIKDNAIKLFTDIIAAKESGKKLPKVLDKVADVAIKAKISATDAAVDTAKSEFKKIISWMLAALFFTITIILIIKR